MYSPRISSDYIPALYQHSKDIGSPMTGTVNRYVIQGLASDAMSNHTKSKLPDSYQKSIKSIGLDDIVLKNYAEAGFGDAEIAPFETAEEIADWHARSMDGVKRAILGAKLSEYHSQNYNGRTSGQEWLYRTIALNLNRGFTSALVGYALQPQER